MTMKIIVLLSVVSGVLALPLCVAAAEKKGEMSQAASSAIPLLAGDKGQIMVPDGPYAVEVISDVMLRDARRGKELPVTVCYPKADGKFPVIVFSHDALESGDMVLPLPRFWASYGYVCLMPTHADSIAAPKKQEAPPPAATTGKTVDKSSVAPGRTPPPPSSAVPSTPKPTWGERFRSLFGGGKSGAGRWDDQWTQRAKDVSFLLDSLDGLEAKVSPLKGKLDRKRIGAGGNALGAFTAQILGGATVDVPDKGKGQTFTDTRVKAVLLLSGQGSGQQGLTKQSWSDMRLPMMTVTGSKDRTARGQGTEWKMEPYQYSLAGEKYHLFIEGANHDSFTGKLTEAGDAIAKKHGFAALRERLSKAEASEQKAIFETIKAATLAFWNASLKSDEASQMWLQSDALFNASHKKAKISHR
ncbi:MAG: hypothetical protein NTX50_10820 [Candidatus Sumerlaeota bacterium]|nr:hypothetical protein [Candidatus Sumerlaeota bacterium]